MKATHIPSADEVSSSAPVGWFYSSDYAFTLGIHAKRLISIMKKSGRFESRLNTSGSSLLWRHAMEELTPTQIAAEALLSAAESMGTRTLIGAVAPDTLESLRCIVTASGMEARQGGNEVPSRSDDSPTGEAGDAHEESAQ